MSETTSNKNGIFLVRATLGFFFFMHGLQKAFGVMGGLTYGQFRVVLEDHGVPLANVVSYLVPWVELLIGIALTVGFCHQLAAGIGALLMVGAILYLNWSNGYFLDQTGSHRDGIEYRVAVLAMSLLVFLAGPGSFAYKVDFKQNRPPH